MTKFIIYLIEILLYSERVMKKTIFSILLLAGIVAAQADFAKRVNGVYTLGSSTWQTMSELSAAAEKGDAKAMYTLAWAYDEGAGVKESDKKANKWYKKSAEGLITLANSGDIDAMLALGELYDEGDGVAKDKKKSFEWYKKAADKGVY